MMRTASKPRIAIAFVTLILLVTIGFALSAQSQALTEEEQAAPAVTETRQTPAVFVSEESLAEAGTGSVGYGLRAAGAMIIVLSMIWGTMFLLKRYMPHRFGPLGHKRRIHVLETVPLGEKRSLTLIRIDNEELLLAGTPGSVSLIKEIQVEPEPAKPDRLENTPTSNPEANTKFENVLADEVRQQKPEPAPLSRLTLLRQELEAR